VHSSAELQAEGVVYVLQLGAKPGFCCGPIPTNSSNACWPMNDARNWFPYTAVSSPFACISCRLSPPCRRLCTLAVSPNFRHQQHPYIRTTRPGRSARSKFPLMLVLVNVTYRCPLGVFFAILSRVNHTE